MKPPRTPSPASRHEPELPSDLREIDARLGSHFKSELDAAGDGSSPKTAAMVDRILAATSHELPRPAASYRLSDHPLAALVGLGGVLAAAVLALVALPLPGTSVTIPNVVGQGTAAEIARSPSIDLDLFGQVRESEVMLAAVMAPEDDWLADLTFESDPGIDVGTILESRSFDILDLEDDLVAMLRHSTS